MKDDKQFNETLAMIGTIAGVGEDWYEIGEAEKGEDGNTRYGIYAKTEDIAEKVGKVFERIFANNINIKDSTVTFDMSHHHTDIRGGDDE